MGDQFKVFLYPECMVINFHHQQEEEYLNLLILITKCHNVFFCVCVVYFQDVTHCKAHENIYIHSKNA